ncbi:MAG: tetratricopeptide repeat protein [Deltaproteobacteria bacterium]|nr:tetratricopeptide repeat protein [Deltaproteobacteria bacterium]
MKRINLLFTGFFASLLFLTVFPPAAFPEILDLNPGIADLKDGDYEEAVEFFKSVREKDPDSSLAAYYLGLAYVKSEDYRSAKPHLKDAITLTPRVREAVIELADVLYQLGEYIEALSTIEVAEKEGIEPGRASFLKGLTLIKVKRSEEAIEAFRKAKSLDESLSGPADYQIAVASVQAGRLGEAKDIFKDLASKDPNADVAESAREYIDAISKRQKEERPLKLKAGLEYQFDDNVLLKPDDASVAGDITNESDSVFAASFSADYDFKPSLPYSLKAGYSLYANRHSSLETHDIQSHSLAVTPGMGLAKGQANLYAGYTYTLVDETKYLQALTLSPTYTLPINERQFAQASVRWQAKDYLKYTAGVGADEDRDSRDYGAGASWFYLLSGGKGFFNARYDFNYEDTDGRNWTYYGNKFGAGVYYPVTEKLGLNVSVEEYIQSFTDTHTAFGVEREDTTLTFYTLLTYPLYDNLDIKAQYLFIRGDSNISIYDYSKNVYGFGVDYRF